MNALEYGRLTVSARLVGLSQACLDYATSYANSRVIRGQPIAKFQMIQQLIADMTVETDAARLMTHRTGWLMDQGELQHAHRHAPSTLLGGWPNRPRSRLRKFTRAMHWLTSIQSPN